MPKSKITKRHQAVTLESVDSKIDLVLEGHATLDAKIDRNHAEFKDFRKEVNSRFDEVDYKFGLVFEQLDIVRTDLKQKVGRDEFVLLEKRVERLEKSVHK